MPDNKMITRRNMLKATVVGASSVAMGGIGSKLIADDDATAAKSTAVQVPVKQKCPDFSRIRGPFPILSTPFTETGEVDFEVLAREARYADWCESPGIIWPQSGDSIDLLTQEEKLEGMEVLSKTSQDFRTTSLCLGVQGKDTDEMLVYAKHVKKLAPPAIISRPPDSGKTQDDMRQYWKALASVITDRPVIIQTTGGTQYKGPSPSVELLAELGKEFPNFGYVKEEAGNVLGRASKLIASPSIRRVFGARGGVGWLYESRLGTEGVITERMAYADLFAQIWKLMQSGSDPAKLKDAFSKFTLMMNLNHTHGGGLRGFNLHVLKMRGVFDNTISRHYGPNHSTPKKPIFREHKFSKVALDEVEWRFESLKPYIKSVKFEG